MQLCLGLKVQKKSAQFSVSCKGIRNCLLAQLETRDILTQMKKKVLAKEEN